MINIVNKLIDTIIEALWKNNFITRTVYMIQSVETVKKPKMPYIIITSEATEKKYDIYKEYYLISIYFDVYVENTNPKLSYLIIENIIMAINSIIFSSNGYKSIGVSQENVFNKNYYNFFHVTKTKFNILITKI